MSTAHATSATALVADLASRLAALGWSVAAGPTSDTPTWRLVALVNDPDSADVTRWALTTAGDGDLHVETRSDGGRGAPEEATLDDLTTILDRPGRVMVDDVDGDVHAAPFTLPDRASSLVHALLVHGWATKTVHGLDTANNRFVSVEACRGDHELRLTWHTRDSGTYRLFSALARGDGRGRGWHTTTLTAARDLATGDPR